MYDRDDNIILHINLKEFRLGSFIPISRSNQIKISHAIAFIMSKKKISNLGTLIICFGRPDVIRISLNKTELNFQWFHYFVVFNLVRTYQVGFFLLIVKIEMAIAATTTTVPARMYSSMDDIEGAVTFLLKII